MAEGNELGERGNRIMKLVTVQKDGKEIAGILQDNIVIPFTELGLNYESMNDFITKGSLAELKSCIAAGKGFPLSEAVLCAPIPVPLQDVICLGINYADHADEAAKYKDGFKKEQAKAIYFSKRVNRAVADGEPIQGHFNITSRLDYEVEFGVVIGKDASDVESDKVFDYVLGYTIINDVSARELQTEHTQWYYGKSLDGFTPMGPWIITADEFEKNPPELQLTSKVNGELRQNSNTKFMIYDVVHIISELSKGMTLKAGTIIATGTPAGVGLGFHPPKFLKRDDIVECTIEGIGSIKNKVSE